VLLHLIGFRGNGDSSRNGTMQRDVWGGGGLKVLLRGASGSTWGGGGVGASAGFSSGTGGVLGDTARHTCV
jgi:hypothetical protein